jgi:GDP/UDP-N,N'-diacetylbacillosamine 2-epimerase (hydrolysing)
MNRKRRIAVLTGARSEYGLLESTLRLLHADARCDLFLIVTGMHLSERFGNTIEEIRSSGLPVYAAFPCLEDDDSALGIAHSTAKTTLGLAPILADTAPDALVLLGDRFELLGAATAALMMRIPIVHIHGGESTEGLIDEAVRHAVSKMATMHAVVAEPYRARLIAMGEEPDRVHVIGALGLDGIRTLVPIPRTDLIRAIGLVDRAHFALVTFHPVTLKPGDSVRQVEALCTAIRDLGTVIVTYPNADAENRDIINVFRKFISDHGNSVFIPSLGRHRYLSAMAVADVVVGNSSSGIIEAPSFRVPVVNIGERQQGRLRHANIIDCRPHESAITEALKHALDPAFRSSLSGLKSRFGDGYAAERLVSLLLDQPLPPIIKPFHDSQAFHDSVIASGLRA